MDVPYPVNHGYSFHWQRKRELHRINTTPNHPEIETFPRYVHNGKEENITSDTVISLENPQRRTLAAFLGHKAYQNMNMKTLFLT